MKIDNLDARNHSQQFKPGFDYTFDARVLMQRDSEGYRPTQLWPQILKAIRQKQHERCHLERPRPAHLLDRRQCRFRELYMATGAPGDDAGFSFGKLVERICGDTSGYFDITGACLNDAAAMAWASHDLIGNPKRIHYIERQKGDMRRLEHIAASIEDEVRPLPGFGGRTGLKPLVYPLAEPAQFIR